jgi:redox-sensitive bicupin YhaK (pirin superfamily)
MYNQFVYNLKPLSFTWQTGNPFLFCVHHLDNYPKGNKELGPAASLAGRNLGQDFIVKDGWRMYHGERIPGFPAHPHRGFETITVVLSGFVDHTDSHGAAGRYGNGDVQWMTAGAGLQHAEMFPLLNSDKENPLELFQIWLNLPAEKKFADPYYTMLWAEDIPIISETDENGNNTQVRLIAGKLRDRHAPDPAPDSWAANPDNEVGIWLIKTEPNAQWEIPAAKGGINRSLYYYRGKQLKLGGVDIEPYHSADLASEQEIVLENGDETSYLLLLQGKPINEPVVQHGPFVMNTADEIRQAFSDFRETGFGGWPQKPHDNVHGPEAKRFAKYSDGREEFPA